MYDSIFFGFPTVSSDVKRPVPSIKPCRHGASLLPTASIRKGCLVKRLGVSAMLLAQLPDKRIVHPIFYLPTELIAMMAKHLSDGDLYNLTRVSYHMASIACPIFLRRKDLTFSSHMNTVSLHGEAFKAFDVWLRSPEFSAGKRLLCSFSRDMTYAALQMKYLYRCFNEFPLQPRTFFRHVRLTDVETRNVGDLLQLLALTVFRTGCPDVTMTHVTYQEAPRRTRKSVMAGKCVVVLESLQRLKLSYFQLSLLQWGDFLSKLYIPSLHFFEVVGPTSMVAIYEFLLRHSDIHRLYFIMCVWTDIPSLSRLLDLPNLRSLRGYSYQVKFVLSSLRSPPDLHELVIDSDPAAKWQSGGFIDEFVDCLSMCEGSVTVEISLSRESVSELTSTAARAFAARKLHSTRLPTVISLRIGFSDMDEVFPAHCEVWMALFPHLQSVRLYKSGLCGDVLRCANDTLNIVWDKVASLTTLIP